MWSVWNTETHSHTSDGRKNNPSTAHWLTSHCSHRDQYCIPDSIRLPCYSNLHMKTDCQSRGNMWMLSWSPGFDKTQHISGFSTTPTVHCYSKKHNLSFRFVAWPYFMLSHVTHTHTRTHIHTRLSVYDCTRQLHPQASVISQRDSCWNVRSMLHLWFKITTLHVRQLDVYVCQRTGDITVSRNIGGRGQILQLSLRI